jgi:hypothetical protein
VQQYHSVCAEHLLNPINNRWYKRVDVGYQSDGTIEILYDLTCITPFAAGLSLVEELSRHISQGEEQSHRAFLMDAFEKIFGEIAIIAPNSRFITTAAPESEWTSH